MKKNEYAELSEFLESTASIKEAASKINQFFELKKIILTPKSGKEDSERNYSNIHDEFTDIRMFINFAKQVLRKYKAVCERMIQSDEFTFNEKKAHLLFCRSLFEFAKSKHNYSDLLGFTTHDLFYLSSKRKHEQRVDFDELTLSEAERNLIREFFDVRIEAYQVLLTNTNNYLHWLELKLFENTQFKLKPKFATRLLWELVLTLSHTNRYIDLKESEKELFEKTVFEFFGLPHKDRGKMLGNYFRKGAAFAKELSILKNTLMDIDKENLIKSYKEKKLK